MKTVISSIRFDPYKGIIPDGIFSSGNNNPQICHNLSWQFETTGGKIIVPKIGQYVITYSDNTQELK